MQPGILDHLLAVALIAVMPVRGVRDHDRLLAEVHRGDPDARVHAYGRALWHEWLAVAVLVALWSWAQRSWIDLGFGGSTSTWAVGGWIVTGLLTLALALQAVLAPRSEKGREALRQQLQSLRELIPHDVREARWFGVLSVTAGVCEELLYRGFLLVYFDSLLGLWPAVVLSSVVFGLGHAYQGVPGVAKTAVIGLVLALLLVATGSLLAPMIVHTAIDLSSGHVGRRVVSDWKPVTI